MHCIYDTDDAHGMLDDFSMDARLYLLRTWDDAPSSRMNDS